LYPDTLDVLGVQLSDAVCEPGGGAATPVPDKVTFAGEPVALLVTETLPDAFPAADAVNCTPTVTLWLGVNVTADPPLVIANPVPLLLIDEIATLEFPVLVILKSCTAEELPSFTFPKFKLVGLTDNVSAAAVPVPLIGIAVGDSTALLTSVIVPLALPAVVGANFTVKLAVSPAASVFGALSPV